jgi:multidrug efflux pump subunit AcrB
MNPIVFALRRPWTVLVAIVGLALAAVFATDRMAVDIFPSLNLPVIYVAQPYGGMDPGQMEGLLTYYYEYHFLYISGIHHVESKNIQGNALMKLYFHPGTNMSQAMAETIGYVNRARAFMPYGTVPPFITRFDTGSVPVGFLVLEANEYQEEGQTRVRSIGEIQNLALNQVRPIFASLPGVSAPPPFGGNQRTMVVNVRPYDLDAAHATLKDVIDAVNNNNVIAPSGNVRIGDQQPFVVTDAMARTPAELKQIPLRAGSKLRLDEVADIEEATDIPTGYALVNGTRAVYILVTKRADASTLSVVNEVKANLGRMQDVLPPDVHVRFEFDQSPYVTRAMWGVGSEAALGAILTGLMVLLFLRDWRSVIVVVLNIPLALFGSVVALWLSGQTMNLMTLGGLALAVGILVDEATVEVENIHTQLERTGSIARAVRLGNAETAVPRLLAMVCVLAVFVSSFFMEGAIRSLFVPLALAVGFAMITSYLLSSTFVPVLSVWLLRRHERLHEAAHQPNRWLVSYDRVVTWVANRRTVMVPVYLAVAAVVALGGYLLVGKEIFPTVDAGQFQLRLRATPGTRIERTEEITKAAVDSIKDMVGDKNVSLSIAYIGTIPAAYPINTVYTWMGGPEEALLRVALGKGSHRSIDELQEAIRHELPERIRKRLQERGWDQTELDHCLGQLQLSFEPADIVNDVMSFGTRTPIQIDVSGPNFADTRAYADKVFARFKQIASLRDQQIMQSLDYPTVEVSVDKQKLGENASLAQLTASLVAATSSSRFLFPMYWADPRTGIGYQIQVQVPLEKMKEHGDLQQLPIAVDTDGRTIRLRDVTLPEKPVTAGKAVPGEYDRYNMRRTVSMTANIRGADLGRVGGSVQTAVNDLAKADPPPRGVQVEVRGQVQPMQQMFQSLGLGLAVAVAAIFLLLTAYFQSPRLAITVLSTVPVVAAGVALALLLTRTTLNIQSYMGAIMAIGVSVANAILLVTFAERARLAGQTPLAAGIDGAKHRLRPILMTTCAMVAGMIPMALAIGEGGEQMAPLGRAVIGGLLAATATTLFVLPAVFALVQGWWIPRRPSLDPDDPQSEHYHPSAPEPSTE